MSDRTSFYPELARDIAPAGGALGVLLPGLGAVATTLVAGVHLIGKGLARPFGSLTQMQKMRLGKRTEPRFTPIKELVPLAEPRDLVFGGWDIFPDDAYESAVKAGVVPHELLSAVKGELSALSPWPAVFERAWVRNLDGHHCKQAPSKMHLAEALIADIEGFRKRTGVARSVMVWCGSTEVYAQSSAVHESLPAFEKGLKESSPDISPSMIYAYASILSGIPFA
ncbi:MAG: inositol-3-phosphate synthase, partial [Thermoanaerobaculia bacterium]